MTTTWPIHGSDLRSPLNPATVRRLTAASWANPNTPHRLTTTAITDPDRPVSLSVSVDTDHHGSGWWANSDYDTCLHISLTHPRDDLPPVWRPANPAAGFPGGLCRQLETPTDDEARAWARVFFGEHATKSWLEPAASMFDAYRLPNVVHVRLFYDQQRRPITPTGEVYTLKPFADGSSPPKITDGRAGADVR